jgi:hypothetical protein
MKTRIRLSITCAGTDICHQLASVLSPDNTGAPHGMSLKMRARNETVEFQIASDSPAGAISTAMAVIRDVLLFQEVWLLSQARGT